MLTPQLWAQIRQCASVHKGQSLKKLIKIHQIRILRKTLYILAESDWLYYCTNFQEILVVLKFWQITFFFNSICFQFIENAKFHEKKTRFQDRMQHYFMAQKNLTTRALSGCWHTVFFASVPGAFIRHNTVSNSWMSDIMYQMAWLMLAISNQVR